MILLLNLLAPLNGNKGLTIIMGINQEYLNKIIDKICVNDDKEYKVFIKKIIISMSQGEKWNNLSDLNDLTEKIKK